MFLLVLLINAIDDSFLLNLLHFKVNRRNIHNNNLFYTPHFSQSYTLHDPINFLMFCVDNQALNELFK